MKEKLFEAILNADDIDRIGSSFGYAVEGAELYNAFEEMYEYFRW